MVLADVRRRMAQWLQELVHAVWPEGHAASLAQEIECLQQSMRGVCHDLLRQRRHIEAVQRNLDRYEQRTAALLWQVQTCLQAGDHAGAWRAALELDEVRHLLKRERARLQASCAFYEHQVQRLVYQQRQLAHLQLQLRRARVTPAWA